MCGNILPNKTIQFFKVNNSCLLSLFHYKNSYMDILKQTVLWYSLIIYLKMNMYMSYDWVKSNDLKFLCFVSFTNYSSINLHLYVLTLRLSFFFFFSKLVAKQGCIQYVCVFTAHCYLFLVNWSLYLLRLFTHLF